jgi:hypothetical protein
MKRRIKFTYADHEVSVRKYAQLIEDNGGAVFSVSSAVAARFCIWYTVDDTPEGIEAEERIHRKIING